MAQAILGRHAGPLAKLLADARLAAYLGGAARAARGLPEGPRRSHPSEATAPPAGPVARKAITWDGWKAWQPLVSAALKRLNSLRLLHPDDYVVHAREERESAATAAGARSDAALVTLRQALKEAVGKGLPLQKFNERMAGVLGESSVSPNRLENVFRHSTGAAYLNGLEDLASRPGVRDAFPYRQRLITLDSRITDLCRKLGKSGLNGTAVMRADDPAWKHFRPRTHYGCRCGIRLLSVEDAAKLGVKEAKQWLKKGTPPVSPAHVSWPKVQLPDGWEPGGVELSAWVEDASA